MTFTATATATGPPHAESSAAGERWWMRLAAGADDPCGRQRDRVLPRAAGRQRPVGGTGPGVRGQARSRAGLLVQLVRRWVDAGNYSLVTPYLCAAIGTELVGALSGVAAVVLVCVAVRDTAHETTAAYFGALGVLSTMWSGRIPFLLGSAFALGALIAVRYGKRWLKWCSPCSASPRRRWPARFSCSACPGRSSRRGPRRTARSSPTPPSRPARRCCSPRWPSAHPGRNRSPTGSSWSSASPSSCCSPARPITCAPRSG